MSHGMKGGAGAVAAGAVAVVVSLVLAAVTLGDGGTPDGGTDKSVAGAGSSAGEPASSEAGAGDVSSPTKGTGPDGLCIAHDDLVAALEAIGTVDTPGELEAFVATQLTFYSTAAHNEPDPDAAAFRSMADYFTALQAFYSARGWQQTVSIADAAAVPQLPGDGASARTSAILAERCAVSAPRDTRGG